MSNAPFFVFQLSSPEVAKRLIGFPEVGPYRTQLPVTAVGAVRYAEQEASMAAPQAPLPRHRDATGGFLGGLVAALNRDHIVPLEEHGPSALDAPPEAEAYLESVLPRYVKTREPLTSEQIHRRLAVIGQPKTRGELRRALEAFAIPAGFFSPSAELAELDAEAEGLWPWDAEGAKLDANHARDIEVERIARAEFARRVDEDQIIERVQDHGLVAVFANNAAPPVSLPMSILAGPFGAFHGHVPYQLGDEHGKLFLFRAIPGVDFPAGRMTARRESMFERGTVTTEARILSDAFLPRGVLRRATVLDITGDWREVRRADSSPVDVFRDGRTAEGEYAEEQFRAWLDALPPHHRLGAHCIVDAGIRGFGLHPRIVSTVCASRGINATSHIDDAVTGSRPWFDVDELYVAPPKSFVERFVSFFRGDDPWMETIDELIASGDAVTMEQVEDALERQGLREGRMVNDDYRRIDGLMQLRGMKKTRKVVDGQKLRVYVRDGKKVHHGHQQTTTVTPSPEELEMLRALVREEAEDAPMPTVERLRDMLAKDS